VGTLILRRISVVWSWVIAAAVVVVEQAVQLDEHRVGLVGQLGHPREDIFGVVAVDEHGEASLSPMALSSSTSCYHLPRASIRSNPGLRGSNSHR
jgi:hypothetical protein